jgi:hypothetical protein
LYFGNLAWLTTKYVLCRKSTDLSWEGEEPDAAVAKENPPAAVEESVPLAQAETVAQGAEATPSEATVVEGMYSSTALFASGSHIPQVLTPHVLR